jgi:hypothetical protein
LKGDFNRHYAMKIYLMHKLSPMTCPLQMNQEYQAAKLASMANMA